jgi:predicted nucleic acid-binding protein
MSIVQVLSIVRELMALPDIVMLQPGPRHAEILEGLVKDYKLTGAKISDAVFAALAIEHGAFLASADRDFRRFETLRWINPLASRSK